MTTFKAAERNAYNIDWIVGNEATPDVELYENDTLVTLRERARQLVKDNPIIAGLQQLFINMVGIPNAIRVKSERRILQDQAQERIDEFCSNATFDNLTISELVEQIVACSFVEGDLLISLPLDTNRPLGRQTVVELIEGNRIKTPSDLSKNENIRNGVQYDDAGRIEGYWVKKYSKIGSYSDVRDNYIFYPRVRKNRVVTQLFKAPLNARPKMSRQYPVITPIIPLIKHLDDYLEAVIIGARVAACFSAFVTTSNPAKTVQAMTTDVDPKDPYSTRRVTKLKPGLISYLKPTESITFADPNKPSDNVDDFIVRLQRLISMYVRIPYEIAFLDLSETNYSSWRGGDNEVKKLKIRWRKRIDAYLQWIIETVLYEASLFNVIRTGESRLKIRWPANIAIDAFKENKANEVDLKNRTTTQQRIIEERGDSFEEVNNELLEFELLELERQAKVLLKKKEYEERYGIKFPSEKGLENDVQTSDEESDSENSGA